ncbi:uncharacterized protein MYCFIDRAFT_175107 [Pseudocercospora fijiensis CIRAD86]|uniref:Uncharacterized protein n=1 Tax=Pseudocercospora fijiensis (strain CIRAD86) TaxID=383855 RepID=M2ZXH2_PSEFD|nr:uncharacterized protein MYCFIDRAFT_175107 [Pseudocercospora fijiensis CIRAD86]EME83684.1 hypothetical protein MYCFIDRAFT_175107 [Pseudocercospora fijiensis CIRAD86]
MRKSADARARNVAIRVRAVSRIFASVSADWKERDESLTALEEYQPSCTRLIESISEHPTTAASLQSAKLSAASSSQCREATHFSPSQPAAITESACMIHFSPASNVRHGLEHCFLVRVYMGTMDVVSNAMPVVPRTILLGQMGTLGSADSSAAARLSILISASKASGGCMGWDVVGEAVLVDDKAQASRTPTREADFQGEQARTIIGHSVSSWLGTSIRVEPPLSRACIDLFSCNLHLATSPPPARALATGNQHSSGASVDWIKSQARSIIGHATSYAKECSSWLRIFLQPAPRHLPPEPQLPINQSLVRVGRPIHTRGSMRAELL